MDYFEPTQKDIGRFLSKVEKRPDGCWVWLGYKNAAGYGYFSTPTYKSIVCSRFSIVAFHKCGIPKGNVVRHKCDNPSCVNPEHLLLGTTKENARDTIEHGRAKIGNHHHSITHPELIHRGKPMNTSGKIQESDRIRFLEKCEKDSSGCWLWKRSLSVLGYGGFALLGKTRSAHRSSYLLFKGEIPKGLLVRHLCHNRACVNPEHLAVGTYKENMEDSIKAGTLAGKTRSLQSKLAVSGERNHTAKLTIENVIEIIQQLPFKSNKELGLSYGVDRNNIGHIRSGKTWKHLPRANPETILL